MMKKILLIALFALFCAFAAAEENENEIEIENENEQEFENENEIEIENETEDENEVEVEIEGRQVRVNQRNRTIRSDDDEANSTLELEIEYERENNETKIKVQLSNGYGSEIKIMPDTASQTAIQRLGIRMCNATNNCTIQLKEVGKDGNLTAVYEVEAEKDSKVLGMFKAKMKVHAQIDASTGEIIRSQKPWWAFLATE